MRPKKASVPTLKPRTPPSAHHNTTSHTVRARATTTITITIMAKTKQSIHHPSAPRRQLSVLRPTQSSATRNVTISTLSAQQGRIGAINASLANATQRINAYHTRLIDACAKMSDHPFGLVATRYLAGSLELRLLEVMSTFHPCGLSNSSIFDCCNSIRDALKRAHDAQSHRLLKEVDDLVDSFICNKFDGLSEEACEAYLESEHTGEEYRKMFKINAAITDPFEACGVILAPLRKLLVDAGIPGERFDDACRETARATCRSIMERIDEGRSVEGGSLVLC